MLAMAVIIVVVLAVSGLAFYAMRSKVRLKVSASLLKLASFSIEVESQDGDSAASCRQQGSSNDKLAPWDSCRKTSEPRCSVPSPKADFTLVTSLF